MRSSNNTEIYEAPFLAIPGITTDEVRSLETRINKLIAESWWLNDFF